MNIVEMKPEHLGEVRELCLQLGYSPTLEVLTQQYQQIQSNGDTRLLVASNGSKVLGWIYLAKVIPLTSQTRVQVWGLVVDEQARGRGIGKALVAAG